MHEHANVHIFPAPLNAVPGNKVEEVKTCSPTPLPHVSTHSIKCSSHNTHTDWTNNGAPPPTLQRKSPAKSKDYAPAANHTLPQPQGPGKEFFTRINYAHCPKSMMRLLRSIQGNYFPSFHFFPPTANHHASTSCFATMASPRLGKRQ